MTLKIVSLYKARKINLRHHCHFSYASISIISISVKERVASRGSFISFSVSYCGGRYECYDEGDG